MEGDTARVLVAHGGRSKPSFHTVDVMAASASVSSSRKALLAQVQVPAVASNDVLMASGANGVAALKQRSAAGNGVKGSHEVHVSAAAQSKRVAVVDRSTEPSRRKRSASEAEDEEDDLASAGSARKARKARKVDSDEDASEAEEELKQKKKL